MLKMRNEPRYHGRKDLIDYIQCHMLHEMRLTNPAVLYTCGAQNVTY